MPHSEREGGRRPTRRLHSEPYLVGLLFSKERLSNSLDHLGLKKVRVCLGTWPTTADRAATGWPHVSPWGNCEGWAQESTWRQAKERARAHSLSSRRSSRRHLHHRHEHSGYFKTHPEACQRVKRLHGGQQAHIMIYLLHLPVLCYMNL